MNVAQKGVVYLWALFAVTVAGVVMAGTGQLWQTKLQREKEQELLFIGDQYRKAIMSYYNNQLTGIKQYPESLEELIEDKRGAVPIRHLRKVFIDPMTLTDEWGIVVEEDAPQQAQGQQGQQGQNRGQNNAGSRSASARKGIIGVYSLSKKKPFKKDNFPEHFAKFSEAETYQDWQFVFTQQSESGTNASQQKQQRQPTTGSTASPFGAQGGASGQNQGAQGGASAPSSPFAPPASGQSGQNPFAR